jgi:hypothetical protein
MNLPSGISSVAIKPIATIIAPGMMVLYPYLIVLGHYNGNLWTAVAEPNASIGLLILIAAIAIGMVIENIGSRIEVSWDNEPNSDESWYGYLAYIGKEPIGFRYISTIVVRLKFELATLVSSIAVIPSIIWLAALNRFSACWQCCLIISLLVGFAFYFGFEARTSARLLAKTRKKIMERLISTESSEG